MIKINIPINTILLIKNLLVFLTLCIHSIFASSTQTAILKLHSGEKINIKLAITNAQQTKGLSGTASKSFKATEGMLFIYKKEGPRQFWMPNTFFNLDIIFLDKNLKVIDIEKNIAHHIGRKDPQKIPRTRLIKARHVLEIKANTALSRKIKKGIIFKWSSKPSLQQIISNIR